MKELNSIPYLGVGLGYRSEFSKKIWENSDKIGIIELISDHYLNCIPGREEEALELSKAFPIVLHGLELSVGTDREVNRDYLLSLKKLSHTLQPKWVSDHLCFTGVDSHGLSTLTPLPFSKYIVDIVVKNIKLVKSYLDCPFLIENISYLFTVPPSEMLESQFITEILEKSDCHLLLDLTNVLNNSTNFNYDPYEFLDQIPLSRVVQIHLAGGVTDDGLLIDSHNEEIPDEVFRLLEYSLPKMTNLKAISIERDDNFPEFIEILSDIEKVESVCSKAGLETKSTENICEK